MRSQLGDLICGEVKRVRYTTDVKPTTHPFQLINVIREENAEHGLEREE